MTDTKNWFTIYPAYINSNRTEAQGRRISKARCVADPKWQEINDVLGVNKDFQVLAEPNKIYPRELDKEIAACRGRVKYQTTNPKFAKKKEVLNYLAETIPKLKTRAKGAGQSTDVVTEQPQVKKDKTKKGRKN